MNLLAWFHEDLIKGTLLYHLWTTPGNLERCLLCNNLYFTIAYIRLPQNNNHFTLTNNSGKQAKRTRRTKQTKQTKKKTIVEQFGLLTQFRHIRKTAAKTNMPNKLENQYNVHNLDQLNKTSIIFRQHMYKILAV